MGLQNNYKRACSERDELRQKLRACAVELAKAYTVVVQQGDLLNVAADILDTMEHRTASAWRRSLSLAPEVRQGQTKELRMSEEKRREYLQKRQLVRLGLARLLSKETGQPIQGNPEESGDPLRGLQGRGPLTR